MEKHTRVAAIAIVAMLTLLAALPTAAQQEFKRKLEQVTFVPKGAYVAGISVSYSQSDQDKYQFLIFENLSGDTYEFKVSPTLMYCFKDNLTAGGRFSYNRQRTRLNSADIVLGAGTEYNVDDLYSISHNYFGTALFRVYMSLGRSTRFGLFNEVQLQVGGGQSKLVSGSGASLTGTYERNVQFNVGLAPGLSVFLSNYSALEVNVGVLGFNYNNTRSVSDQIYNARRQTQRANFKVNLFSITFGVMFYI
ncbi:MAG: hypothetical protein NC418_01755 [Muribaculaceae bacterium]|nr:hypothetical protein [Muribaculaceae bacterium]